MEEKPNVESRSCFIVSQVSWKTKSKRVQLPFSRVQESSEVVSYFLSVLEWLLLLLLQLFLEWQAGR